MRNALPYFIRKDSAIMSSSFKTSIGIPGWVKYGLISLGIAGLVTGILCILIVPSQIEIAKECEELGLIVDSKCMAKNLAFVVGDTKNTPAPIVNLEGYLEVVMKQKGRKISKISVSKPSSAPTSVSGKKFKDIKEEIKNMKAEADGADYLEAIRSAASSFQNKDESVIYVIGSGLSDRGLLDFANNDYLNSSIDIENLSNTIAKKFSKNSIDELKGVKIVWDGLGQVAYNDKYQTPLSFDQKRTLENIYEAVLGKLGATHIKWEHQLSGDESANTDKKLKATRIIEEAIDYYEEFSELTTDVFKFKANSAELSDEATTRTKVAELAAKLKDHPSAKATINVYHANPDCRGIVDSILLSNRQETVQSLFLQEGVNSNRIEIGERGIGSVTKNCQGKSPSESELAQDRMVSIRISNKQS
jgi:hypothetical protein